MELCWEVAVSTIGQGLSRVKPHLINHPNWKTTLVERLSSSMLYTCNYQYNWIDIILVQFSLHHEFKCNLICRCGSFKLTLHPAREKLESEVGIIQGDDDNHKMLDKT